MSKKKALKQKKAQKPSKRSQKNTAGIIILVLCLLLLLAGSILAQWRSTRVANSMNAMLVTTPVVPGPGSPTKEYIYAGGRLLATEEPTTGATITNGAEQVAWANVVGATATANSLTKTAVAGWGNAGAVSTRAIVSGDGYVEFTATEVSYRLCGLSNGDTDQNYNDVDYAIFLEADGTIAILEAGVNQGIVGNYVVGDHLRVSVESGVIKYWKISNGSFTLLYSHTITPTYPLLVDTSLHDASSTITNAVISGTLSALPSINVALASNNAVASASSVNSTNYPASAVIDGDRKGLNNGAGGVWASGTYNSVDDWVEVTFNGSKTINEIDVFTIQDDYWVPSDPTEAMTFTHYGLTGFDVRYWTGSAWVTVSNGSITLNNKVWRKFTFSQISTSKIRVFCTGAMDGWSRVTEIEAWGN